MFCAHNDIYTQDNMEWHFDESSISASTGKETYSTARQQEVLPHAKGLGEKRHFVFLHNSNYES